MTKKINAIIHKINEDFNFDRDKYSEEYYYFYNILYVFLEDYYKTERLNEKTLDEICNRDYYHGTWRGRWAFEERDKAEQMLNLLCERGILLKSNRKTLNNDLIDIYCLSYAYINNIENMIKYAKTENNEVVKTNYKPIKDEKTLDFLQSHLEAYRKYNEVVINDISDILKECFNFHVEIDNGMIDFQMGGCDYNVYLSRGYIVLEEADNSTIENAWTVEDISEFIDLIKDLREDN